MRVLIYKRTHNGEKIEITIQECVKENTICKK